jgi:vacuolar-type H+-ATPase subunit C/Vma6
VAGTVPVRELEGSLKAGAAVWPPAIAAALRVILEQSSSRGPGDWIDLALDLAWLGHARDFASLRRQPLLALYFECLEDFAAVKVCWRHLALPRHAAASTALRTWRLDPEVKTARDRDRLADLLLASPYGPSLKEGLSDWKAGGAWALLDRDIDNALLEVLGGARYLSLGPEPLAAYLLSREHDLKNLRLVHALRTAGRPEHEVRRHVRRTHA